MLYPNFQLIIFTDCGNWKIFSIKGGEDQLHHVNSNIIANNDWWVYTSCLYLVNIVIDWLQLSSSLPCWMTSDKRIIISFIVLVMQHGHQSLCHFNLSGMTANHLLKAFGIIPSFSLFFSMFFWVDHHFLSLDSKCCSKIPTVTAVFLLKCAKIKGILLKLTKFIYIILWFDMTFLWVTLTCSLKAKTFFNSLITHSIFS